jgi:tRNA G18 (ribose-2'-O)-methylase SpoU
VPVIRIDGSDDSRIQVYRDIPDPELIRSRGLFIAEGRLVVRRLIGEGRHRVHSLLLSEASFNAIESSLASLPPETPVYICPPSAFAAITGFNLHRGCLALADRPQELATREILRAAKTLVILEGVTNPDNVGGVFRNAAAFEADGVLLDPASCDPYYRKAIRTSMGAALRVPFARIPRWPGGLADVRAWGFTIVALTPRHPSVALDRFCAATPPHRLALLVGTEGAGLSEAAECLSDVRVRIPIGDAVDSLNLAVATGIALARLSPGAGL